MVELRRRRIVFHGLPKSAEAGCTDAGTVAITGQSRDMVEHYAKQVNQRRLTAAAILKWETADAACAAKRKKPELYNRLQNLYNRMRTEQRKLLVPPPGLEPGTPRSTIWCSNQLS